MANAARGAAAPIAYAPPPGWFRPSARLDRWRYLVRAVAVSLGGHVVTQAGLHLLGPVALQHVLLFLQAVTLAVLALELLLAVQRLHDFDASGWWAALTVAWGLVVHMVAVDGGLPLAAIFAAAYLPHAVLLALPGTPGPNRFGPPPLPFGRRPPATG